MEKFSKVVLFLGISFYFGSSYGASPNCSESAILNANKDYRSYKKAGGVFAMEATYFSKTESQKCELAILRDSVKKGDFKQRACPKNPELSHVACFQSYLSKLPFLAYTETDTLDLLVLKVVNKDLQNDLVSWFVSDVQALELRIFLLERLASRSALALKFKGKNKKQKLEIKKKIIDPDRKGKMEVAKWLSKSIRKGLKKMGERSREPANSSDEKEWAKKILRTTKKRLKKMKKILRL